MALGDDCARRCLSCGPRGNAILYADRCSRVICFRRGDRARRRARLRAHEPWPVLVFFHCRLAGNFWSRGAGMITGTGNRRSWSAARRSRSVTSAWCASVDFNRAPYFLAGVLLLLLDLVSPIDTLGDQYLFSAHIVQHFLLALVIPPLLLLGTPAFDLGPSADWNASSASRRYPGCSASARCSAWHIPALFNAALANDGLHIFQHLSFLITGTIFWWPILGPLEERRLPPLGGCLVFVQCLRVLQPAGCVSDFRPGGPLPCVPESASAHMGTRSARAISNWAEC